MHLGIALQTGAEAGQVLEPQFLGNGQHLGLVLTNLVEANLVNLLRRQAGCGRALDQKPVVLRPVGKGIDSGRRAPRRHVARLKEARKAQVRRQHFLTDRLQHLRLDALLLRRGNCSGKLLERQRQRRVLRLLTSQLLHLLQRLFEQILRRHAAVVHADRHVLDHLRKSEGERVQPRNPVVVIFHRRKAQLRRQPRIGVVDARPLVDRHLPLFKLRALFVQLETANQQFLACLLVVCKSCWIDRRQPQQQLLLLGQPFVYRAHTIIGDLVVVPLVANLRGILGIAFQPVLPVLVEQIAQSLAPLLERLRRRSRRRRKRRLLRVQRGPGRHREQRKQCRNSSQRKPGEFSQGSGSFWARYGRCVEFRTVVWDRWSSPLRCHPE